MQRSSSNRLIKILFVLPLACLSFSGIEASFAADATSGKATIYSDKFKGKKTASGEKYKPGAMTAASNKLPIGSKVMIKNRKTGKRVTVTINDRMAKNAKAKVDLSKAAANKLGVKGTAPIDAKVISK